MQADRRGHVQRECSVFPRYAFFFFALIERLTPIELCRGPAVCKRRCTLGWLVRGDGGVQLRARHRGRCRHRRAPFARDAPFYSPRLPQLKLIGANGVPFGVRPFLACAASHTHTEQVKGGGHASNPGFSSSTGIQISLARFKDVVYDAAAGTATIGTGLLWDDVYEALAPWAVNVVGGRVSGVGVAGFTLGGGASCVHCV